jgi:hypothetical protein
VVFFKDNEPSVPAILLDNEQGFGMTRSLCSADAMKYFNSFSDRGNYTGTTVASDGVVDSFDQASGKYLTFNETLRKNFTETPEEAREELKRFLPELSRRGSKDDVSIAGIFC